MKRLRLRLAATACAVAAVACAGCGSSRPALSGACVTVPAAYTSKDLAVDGGRISVRRGAVVFVVLVEPERYDTRGYPPGFPWRSSVSSVRDVLVPVRLCKQVRAYTLALTVSPFRAVGAGSSTLAAPLAAGWRSARSGLAGYRAVVTVR
jgi:hypothetical protein